MTEETLFDASGVPHLQPEDGYRTKCVLYPNGPVTLWVQFRIMGEIVHTTEIYSWADKTPYTMGACARLRLLLEAVCRFLNSGGSLMPEMSGSLPEAIQLLVAANVHGLELPDKYLLVDSFQNDQLEWEHLFLNPANDGLRWVEDGFVDPLTCEEVAEQLERSAQGADRDDLEELSARADSAAARTAGEDPEEVQSAAAHTEAAGDVGRLADEGLAGQD